MDDNMLVVVEDNSFVIPEKNKAMVKKLEDGIKIQDSNSIVAYGSDTAMEISKTSDKIIQKFEQDKSTPSSELLNKLADIINKFDMKDFQEEDANKGFLTKLFRKAKRNIKELLAKYNSITQELEEIVATINTYKKDLNKTNVELDNLYADNIKYLENLQCHIFAGNNVVEKLKTELIPPLLQKKDLSNDDSLAYNEAVNSLELLEQKIYDLKIAESVTMQAMLILQGIRKTNVTLVRKIESSFIITIPVFKSALVSALALKQQKNHTDAIDGLDRTTNELLLKNANNVVSQSLQVQKMMSSGIKIETLESSWRTILDGIDASVQLQKEIAQEREIGTQKLQELKQQAKNRI